jgi:hypothetical protein
MFKRGPGNRLQRCITMIVGGPASYNESPTGAQGAKSDWIRTVIGNVTLIDYFTVHGQDNFNKRNGLCQVISVGFARKPRDFMSFLRNTRNRSEQGRKSPISAAWKA